MGTITFHSAILIKKKVEVGDAQHEVDFLTVHFTNSLFLQYLFVSEYFHSSKVLKL